MVLLWKFGSEAESSSGAEILKAVADWVELWSWSVGQAHFRGGLKPQPAGEDTVPSTPWASLGPTTAPFPGPQ